MGQIWRIELVDLTQPGEQTGSLPALSCCRKRRESEFPQLQRRAPHRGEALNPAVCSRAMETEGRNTKNTRTKITSTRLQRRLMAVRHANLSEGSACTNDPRMTERERQMLAWRDKNERERQLEREKRKGKERRCCHNSLGYLLTYLDTRLQARCMCIIPGVTAASPALSSTNSFSLTYYVPCTYLTTRIQTLRSFRLFQLHQQLCIATWTCSSRLP